MQWSKQSIRHGRNDCERIEHLAFCIAPAIPQTGKRKRLLILQVNPNRHLAIAFSAPLVEPIGWNKAAPLLDQSLKARFVGDRLSTGVDHASANRSIRCPRR